MGTIWRDGTRTGSGRWLPVRCLALVYLLTTFSEVAVGAEPRQKLVGHTSTVGWLAFSSNGQRLASSDSRRILLWDLETGESQELFGPPDEDDLDVPRPGRFPRFPEIWLAFGLAFADDDEMLLAFLGRMPPPMVLQRKIASWSIPDGRRGRDIVLTPTLGVAAATQLNVSPNGKTIAVSAIGPGGFLLVNRRLRRASSLTLPGASPLAIDSATCAFSSDGKLLAVSRGSHGFIEIWDMSRRRLRRKITPASGEVMQFTGDDGRLITISGGVIRVYDVSTGNPVRPVEEQQAEMYQWPGRGAISSDAALVAIVDPESKTVRFHDAESGNLRGTLNHERTIVTVAFSPDGQTLAVATTSQTMAPFGSSRPGEAAADGGTNSDGDSPPASDDPAGSAPENQAAGETPDASGEGGVGDGGGMFGPSGGIIVGGRTDPEDSAIELWDVPGILQTI